MITKMLHFLYCFLRNMCAFIVDFGQDVRLAHAFRSVPTATDTGDLDEVLRILNGTDALTPRPPADPTAVNDAERLLGVPNPPIYTYAGCLHPQLGTIG